MRTAWVVSCCLVSTALSGCWYFEPCPDNNGGIKDGFLLETTVIARHEGAPASEHESCGELGDLGPGKTATWRARLTGSAETCANDVRAQPQSLSGAELSLDSPSTTSPKVTLPNGCTGMWMLQIQPLTDDPTFIGPPDVENPSWVLERSFSASGDVTLCASSARAQTCRDTFVAETRQIEE